MLKQLSCNFGDFLQGVVFEQIFNLSANDDDKDDNDRYTLLRMELEHFS